MSHILNFPTFHGNCTLDSGQLILTASQGIVIPSGAPSTVTNTLYSVGGSLYFNGTQLGAGSSAVSSVNGLTGSVILTQNNLNYVSTVTGSTAITLYKKLSASFDLNEFGAIGDGSSHPLSSVTSFNGVNTTGYTLTQWQTLCPLATSLSQEMDEVAFIHAFAYVPIGATLIVRPGTYIIKNTATISRTSNISILCYPGVVINATAATADTLFSIIGSIGTRYLLTTAINQGDKTLTSVNTTFTSTLSPGDVLFITTDSNYGGNGNLWYGGQTIYYQGEFCEVFSVSSGTITLRNNIIDNYAANSATIAKVNPVLGRVTGFKLVANNQVSPVQAGLLVKYGKGFVVDGGQIDGCSWAGLQLHYCLDFHVERFNCTEGWYTGAGYNYGIQIATCQYGTVVKCRLHAGRNALTIGGWEPNRHIYIDESYLATDGIAQRAFGTHGNCEDVFLRNSTVDGGVLLQGKTHVLENNRLIVRYPIAYYTDSTTAVAGFTSGCRLTIKNNKFYCVDTYVGNNIFLMQLAGTMDTFEFSGNEVLGGNALTSPMLIYLTYLTGYAYGTIKDTYFTRNEISTTNPNTAHAILFDHINLTNVYINWNKIYLPDGVHVYWSTAALSNIVDITDNKFISLNLNSNSLKCSTAGASIIRYNRNEYINTNLAYYAMVLTASQYIEMVGNTWNGMKNGCVNATAPDILYRDNNRFNITGSDTLTGRVYHLKTATGNVVGMGSAAPTSGTWLTGDRYINTSPLGTCEGWECVAGGTPGTWQAYGVPVGISSPTWASSMTVTTNIYSQIRITLGGNTTLTLSPGYDGQKIMLELIQDSTGNRTLSFGSGVIFGSDITSVTLSTGANKVDYIGLIYNSTLGNWRVVAFTRGY
jgi:hypothetical protein